MEGSIGECEIEEESCYYDEHSEQLDYSSGKESSILHKGWGIGKKLLLTGAVISSAPFTLPPLVVTSALAFACWVPCGVVMASYTCSEKIMSKLLPCDSNEDGEEFVDAEEGEKSDDGEYLDMEEMLQSEESNGARMEESTYEYNDDVLLHKNNAISDEVDLEGSEEFGVSPIEVTSVVFEGQEKLSDLLEDEELVKETRGLLENLRDEGSACDGMEMGNHYSDGTPGSRNDFMDMLVDNNVSNVIEGENEIFVEETKENGFVEEEELVKETRGLLEKIRDAGSADSDAVEIIKPYAGVVKQEEDETDENEITGRDFKETGRIVDETLTNVDAGLNGTTITMEGELPNGKENSEEKIYVTGVNVVSEDWGTASDSKSLVNNYGAEGQIREIIDVNDILEAEKSISQRSVDTTSGSTLGETHALVTNKEKSLQAERAENNFSIKEKKYVVFTNADVREIADESGLHLFDENSESGEQGAHTFDHGISICEGNVGGAGANFSELTNRSRINGTTDAKISSRKHNVHSNGQVLKSEDKIWKQIESIRSIVGYEVVPHASYMEELKALYIFTGVEPPASFDDPTDVAQVDNKLRFLMSIIGLK